MKKKDKIREEIVEWSNRFPCDRWWREKHNIPFMSQAHKEISFLDQLREYIEDEMYDELRGRGERYEPNQGDFLRFDDSKSKIDRVREEFERKFLDG